MVWVVDEVGFRVRERRFVFVVNSKILRFVLRFEVVVEVLSSYIMYIRRVKEDVAAVGSD
jgi:hypothetical protein